MTADQKVNVVNAMAILADIVVVLTMVAFMVIRNLNPIWIFILTLGFMVLIGAVRSTLVDDIRERDRLMK